MTRRKRTIAIASALTLAAAGGGVAVAASGGSDPRDAIIDDAAQRLNVRPSELRSALEGAFGDQLDRAVADGKLTQRQADRIKQRIARDGVPLGGPGGPGGGPGFGHGGPGGPGGPFLIGPDAAADYLGLSRAQLRRRLQSGDTLAEIARAEGKSVDGTEQALVDAAKTQLDRAVADGELTASQRDEMLRRLQEHVDDIVAGRGPPAPPRLHGRAGRPGPPPAAGEGRWN